MRGRHRDQLSRLSVLEKESVRHFLPISRMGSHLVITTQLVNAKDGFALLESK